jgi:hypothetical protein
MSGRKQENIERINELWRLHWPKAKGLKPGGRCLAFVIDRRYLGPPSRVEMHLAMSFGHPVVGPVTEENYLRIPVHPGEFVFGLHSVGIKGNQMVVYFGWMDALDAGGCTDPVEAEAKARAILDAMSDEQYIAIVRSSDTDQRPLKVSSRYLLEDLEIVEYIDV